MREYAVSFCQEVKQELMKNPPREYHCRSALLYAVLKLSKTFPQQPTIFTTETRELAEEVATMVAELGAIVDIRRDLHRLRADTEVYTVCIEHENTRGLLQEYYHLGRSPLSAEFLERSCCRAAFLRGLFLAYGSMTNPEKEYHLELNALTPMFAEEIHTLAESCGIRFKMTRRKGCEILYLKESEQIEDFLTLIGATGSSMKLMEVKVMKTVRNHVNRTTNCETANLGKTVSAAAAQLQDIRYIEQTVGLSYLDDDLQELARLRLENETMSLRELSTMLKTPISRSGVNHRLKRISEIAGKLRESDR
jgi:hypothetical protein